MRSVHRVCRRTGLVPTLAAALLATGCATTPQGQSSFALPQQVEAALSPADHEALALRYEQEATEARTRAEEHRALLASYQSGPQYRCIDSEYNHKTARAVHLMSLRPASGGGNSLGSPS